MSPGLDNPDLFGLPFYIGDEDHPLTVWPTYGGIERISWPADVTEAQRRVSSNINAHLDMLATTRFPWEPRCTALVKCGPCALLLYRGGGR